MASRINIGPENGPFVKIDEEDGELVIRVPEDTVDFDTSDIENLGQLNGVIVENHNQRHESGGADELSVTGLSGDLADAQDPKAHSETHGFEGADELATALRYEPEAEPATPTSGCVRWYDETEAAYKAKFDDGETVTIAQK